MSRICPAYQHKVPCDDDACLNGCIQERIEAECAERTEELTAELMKYMGAVKVAREKGEHYPVCNMPPPEVMKADRETQRAWREANRGNCTCWKADMEKALK